MSVLRSFMHFSFRDQVIGPVKHLYTLGVYQSLNALRLRFVTSVDLFTIFGVVSLIWFGYWNLPEF